MQKLARKYTGREIIVSLTNAFHGMSLGALAVTGNSMKRHGAGVPLGHTVPMPCDNYLDGRTPDFLLFERLLDDSGSGLDVPAAVIVETVQGEGGLNAASPEWLVGLTDKAEAHRAGCPAASSSAWRSPARSRCSRRSSCWTRSRRRDFLHAVLDQR